MEKGGSNVTEHYRRGTAAVALRRLAHPGRDGGVVGEGDQLFEVARRLSGASRRRSYRRILVTEGIRRQLELAI
jgi:hypothetical protein